MGVVDLGEWGNGNGAAAAEPFACLAAKVHNFSESGGASRVGLGPLPRPLGLGGADSKHFAGLGRLAWARGAVFCLEFLSTFRNI